MLIKNKIGEKIRKRRIELGLTQKSVASDFMTRNMLSVIESGRATPSLETAEYLAKTLQLPLPYLFSADENLFFYEKKDKMPLILEFYNKGDWNSCIELVESLSDIDDELCLLSFSPGKKKAFSRRAAKLCEAFAEGLRYGKAYLL